MKIQHSYDATSNKQQQAQMGGSRTQHKTQSQQPSNTIYSLQQAAGYNSLSAHQVTPGGLTLNAAARGSTLAVTREDFNIEDIHCQMVYKVQRNNQLLREIEGEPGEQFD